MIFDLEFTENPDAERVWVNILSRQPHCFGSIRAVFDTGSPTTIISARDAVRLSIPLNSLEQGEPIRGFGKGGIPSKKIKRFVFAIRSTDNQIRNIEMPVHVADLTTLRNMPQEYQAHVMQIPTIIGMDFIRCAGMKLVIDSPNHKSYLESQELPSVKT